MITEQPGAITYDSTVVGKAYADLVAQPAVQKELKNMNVHFFYAVNPGGSRWLGTVDKPVKSVADLKGLKIRESGGFAKLYGKLGASPVSMPVPDVYDALAKGTLDGFSGPISAFTAYGFSEVCKYYNRISVGPGEGIWLMNLDRWNEMPPEIQKIMEETTKEFLEYSGPAGEQFAKDALKMIKDAGVTIVDFPASEQEKVYKAAAGIGEAYAKRLDKKGLPGTKGWETWANGLKKYSK